MRRFFMVPRAAPDRVDFPAARSRARSTNQLVRQAGEVNGLQITGTKSDLIHAHEAQDGALGNPGFVKPGDSVAGVKRLIALVEHAKDGHAIHIG